MEEYKIKYAILIHEYDTSGTFSYSMYRMKYNTKFNALCGMDRIAYTVLSKSDRYPASTHMNVKYEFNYE